MVTWIKCVISAINLALSHGWAMRRMYHYDYGYTEQVLLYRLKKLNHALNNDPYHHSLEKMRKEVAELKLLNSPEYDFSIEWMENSIRAYRALNLTIKLLERFINNRYDSIVGLDKIPLPSFDDRDSVTEYVTVVRPLYDMIERMEARDKKLFYNLLAKYSDNWWV